MTILQTVLIDTFYFENCADLIGLYEKFFSILASYCSYITSTGAIHGYCIIE